MSYWFKIIGSSDNPVDRWDQPYVEFSGANGVPQVQDGDLFVLYASQHQIYFALAQATSGVFTTDDIPGAWGGYRIDIAYEKNLDVVGGVHRNEINVDVRSYGQGLLSLTENQYQIIRAAILDKN